MSAVSGRPGHIYIDAGGMLPGARAGSHNCRCYDAGRGALGKHVVADQVAVRLTLADTDEHVPGEPVMLASLDFE